MASASDSINVYVENLPSLVEDGVDESIEPNEENYLIDALDAADIKIKCNTSSFVTISIFKYIKNPHPDVPLPDNTLSNVIDIAVSNLDAVMWPLYVERHYTDEEIVGLDESELVLYYFVDGKWHQCIETGVNTEKNIVWANMMKNELTGSPIVVGEFRSPANFTISELSIL